MQPIDYLLVYVLGVMVGLLVYHVVVTWQERRRDPRRWSESRRD